jgi:hypothetical protein
MCRIITYIVLMCLIITYIVLMCRIITGADLGFQVRGGAHLKNCAERRETRKFVGLWDYGFKNLITYRSIVCTITETMA